MKINFKDKWIEKPSPKLLKKGSGWFAQMNKCYIYNGEYAAMTRELETEWGKVIHCCFRNLTGIVHAHLKYAKLQRDHHACRRVSLCMGDQSISI